MPANNQQSDPKKSKKKALGNPVHWTDQDLDDLARITPADMKAADALWKTQAPAKFKNLLDAGAEKK